jgi:hypothetical protein
MSGASRVKQGYAPDVGGVDLRRYGDFLAIRASSDRVAAQPTKAPSKRSLVYRRLREEDEFVER